MNLVKIEGKIRFLISTLWAIWVMTGLYFVTSMINGSLPSDSRAALETIAIISSALVVGYTADRLFMYQRSSLEEKERSLKVGIFNQAIVALNTMEATLSFSNVAAKRNKLVPPGLKSTIVTLDTQLALLYSNKELFALINQDLNKFAHLKLMIQGFNDYSLMWLENKLAETQNRLDLIDYQRLMSDMNELMGLVSEFKLNLEDSRDRVFYKK